MTSQIALDQSVFEIVVFHLNSGATHEALLETSEPVSEWVAEQPGFIDRKLVRSNDGNTYVEIIRWHSLDEAERAAEIALTSPSCAPMFGLIEFETIQMLHGRAVAEVAEAVAVQDTV